MTRKVRSLTAIFLVLVVSIVSIHGSSNGTDFSLKTVPSSLTFRVPPFGEGLFIGPRVEVDSLGFSGVVHLFASISPRGFSVSVGPSSVELTSGGSNSSAILYLVFNGPLFTPKNYTISITATSGTATHSVQLPVLAYPTPGIGSLILTVRTDRATYNEGNPVNIEIFLTNQGNDSIELHFGMGCHSDFQVEDRNSTVLFSPTFYCTANLNTLIIPPGTPWRVGSFSWDQSTSEGAAVGSGTYVVRGTIPSVEPVNSGTAQIRILNLDPNHDCKVDLGDLGVVALQLIVQAFWSSHSLPESRSLPDVNGDGVVDILDIVVLATSLGKSTC